MASDKSVESNIYINYIIKYTPGIDSSTGRACSSRKHVNSSVRMSISGDCYCTRIHGSKKNNVRSRKNTC